MWTSRGTFASQALTHCPKRHAITPSTTVISSINQRIPSSASAHYVAQRATATLASCRAGDNHNTHRNAHSWAQRSALLGTLALATGTAVAMLSPNQHHELRAESSPPTATPTPTLTATSTTPTPSTLSPTPPAPAPAHVDTAVGALPSAVAAAASAAETAKVTPTSILDTPSVPSTAGVLQVNERGAVNARTLAKLEERFLKHASLQTSGEWVMTPEDFLASMMPNAKRVSASDAARVKMFFAMADIDHSGTLSFSEYVTFFTLLSRPAAEFKIAFKLFDLNNDGYIEKSEFDKVIGTSAYSNLIGKDSAFTNHFFGPDGNKKLTYAEFKVLLQQMTEQILKLEFKQFDRDQSGSISGTDFMKLITQHSDVTSVPAWLLQNLTSRESARVNFDQFIAINHIIQHIKQVETAIRMYTAAGGHVNKSQFKRAVEVSTGVSLSNAEIDILFSIFDRHGSGELDHDSFVYLMSNRAARGLPSAKPPMTILQSLALGGMSAMVGASCVYPMDKVKTRIQSTVGTVTVMQQFKDIGMNFKNIAMKEGFWGLYKGLPAQLVGIVPEKAIKLTVNDFLKRQIRATKPAEANELTLKDEAVAGIGTGLVQVLASTPYELVKIRMQMQTPDGPKKSPITIMRELGIRGMYRGVNATLLRDVPFNAIYFSSYAYFKQVLKNSDGSLSGYSLFAAGMGAGVLGAALDTPADCIKTRLQNGQGDYKGVRDAATKMWRDEGYSAFMKGLAPRVLIIAPLFSITFMVFETLQRTLLPHMRPPLQSLEEEFGLVREQRLKKMTQLLEHEFGLSVVRPGANGSAPVNA
eukprot:TRINITY_DN8115_c0_g1_i1.p1 TRINITY_DN8115_c0_g1~~TRINITY_DN8115_c0_g1_i1.p1  ORF type:complete len:812 (-),score=140.28 TRINITY_DN8115_c0_g1_i1:58-2493(-)